MLTIDQFDYHLPDGKIAQRPISPRDHSRMMIVDCQQQQIFHDRLFKDLPDVINQNTVLVRNNTKVIPARIVGQKNTGGKQELLLLNTIAVENQQEVWTCLTKPGLKPGRTVEFDAGLSGRCLKINGYTRQIKFNQAGRKLMTSLHQIGQTPTPPYIDWQKDDEQALRRQYQTTYAKIKGSAAAPTAGLHFTPELDQILAKKGVECCEVTLHVGLGTFQPVKTKHIKNHQMHSEQFQLSSSAAAKLNQAKQSGKKIIAVGTTTTRVLESCTDSKGKLTARSGQTDIFIYPGCRFKFIDGLITNFHLPQSTLLMLITAFCSSPNTNHQFHQFDQTIVGQAYQQAIERGYRFYSFGDAMLLI